MTKGKDHKGAPAEKSKDKIKADEISAALDRYPHDDQVHSSMGEREYLALRVKQLRDAKISTARIAKSAGIGASRLSQMYITGGDKKPVGDIDSILLHIATYGFISIKHSKPSMHLLIRKISEIEKHIK